MTDFSGGQDESHRLLAEAVREYSGDSSAVGSMYTGQNGKPYIDGFDFFSISHSANVWAVLFCRDECGLDIQLARKCDAASIARRFYHPDDAAVVIEKGADEFFRLWARREALIKAAAGSIAAGDIPSVLGDIVVYEGAEYNIKDIIIPGMPELYAAACVKGGAAFEELTFTKMEDKGKKQKKTAFETACSYLAKRMHTVSEVRKHLESREYGDEEITEAINELIGLRYLDDYLTGDKYFKAKYETQNLDRARNLIALAKSMDSKMPEMRKVIREIVG